MKATTIAFLLLFAGSTLFARVGESLGEIKSRFGEPVSSDDKLQSITWRLGPLIYVVVFAEKVSVAESIGAADKSKRITEAQQEKFLSSHLAKGEKWLARAARGESQIRFGGLDVGVNPFTHAAWMTDSGRLLARQNTLSSGIWVYSEAGIRLMHELARKEEQRSAIDF